MIFKNLIVAAGLFGAIANVQAQLTNSTLLSILNTTQLSPTNKFISFLQSDPQYKPFLDLLASPGNHTVFVPSDKAFNQYIQGNSTHTESQFLNNLNAANEEGNSTDQQQQSVRANAAFLPSHIRILQQQQPQNNSSSGNSTSGGNNSTEFNPFTEGVLANYSITNLLQYHVVNGSWLIKDLNDSSVLRTQLTNKTVDKTGRGLPVVITCYNLTVDASDTQYDNRPAIDDEEDDSLDDVKKNVTAYHIGNGIDFSNITLYDIKASNGVLHIIDRVLVPPGEPSQVVQNLTNATTIAQVISSNQSYANEADNMKNVTYLIPSNQALSQAGISGSFQELLTNLQQQNGSSNGTSQGSNIQNIVKEYILQGVYYLDNLTAIAHRQGQNSVKSTNGDTLAVTATNGTLVKFNNTAAIIQPNILTDNGVIHIIDHLLPNNNGQNSTGSSGQNSTSQN